MFECVCVSVLGNSVVHHCDRVAEAIGFMSLSRSIHISSLCSSKYIIESCTHFPKQKINRYTHIYIHLAFVHSLTLFISALFFLSLSPELPFALVYTVAQYMCLLCYSIVLFHIYGFSLLFRKRSFSCFFLLFLLWPTLRTMKSNVHGIKQKAREFWVFAKMSRTENLVYANTHFGRIGVCVYAEKKRTKNKHQNDLFNY